MPLKEVSNQATTAALSTLSEMQHTPKIMLKRTLEMDNVGVLPSKMKIKRTSDAPSSSSSPGRSSSPFGFHGSRLTVYEDPSSPPPSSGTSPAFAKQATADLESQAIATTSPSKKTNANSKAHLTAIHGKDDSHPLSVLLDDQTMIYFGRKAKTGVVLPHLNTLPVLLPKSAKNASRLHCSVCLANSTSQLGGQKRTAEVKVLGQNGMRVNNVYYKSGTIARLRVGNGEGIKLQFWGWTAVIQAQFNENRTLDQAEDYASKFSTTSPASSVFNPLFDESPDRRKMDKIQSPQSDAILPEAALPLPSQDGSNLSTPASSPCKATQLVAAGESPSLNVYGAETVIQQLALDLPGLIASTIVFHPRATVGVEEVIKALLHEVGGMWDVLKGGKIDEEDKQREPLATQAWRAAVESVLRNNPFFGCIENMGLKDASGNPLAAAFYYLPEFDPSRSRAEALEPFVKRVRGARATGKQYYFKRPSIKKNR